MASSSSSSSSEQHVVPVPDRTLTAQQVMESLPRAVIDADARRWRSVLSMCGSRVYRE